MTTFAIPEVHPIAWTHYDADAAARVMAGFRTDAGGGQALAEAAGRSCYGSFSRPNPATATNAGYLMHILEVGHGSVLEHATVTFYITGVSRSFTHEMVRHRAGFAYSQLSQRYVDESTAAMVVPDIIAGDADCLETFEQATGAAATNYRYLVQRLTERLQVKHPGWTKTELRKAARQAARSVLPNATETRIVVTGNYRAWRHFIDMRATRHADVEIRDVAIQVLRHLQVIAPNVFTDYIVRELDDGTEVAASRHAGASG